MSDLKIEARKALFLDENPSLFEVGECVFIRTVTYHLVGRVLAVVKSGAKEWVVLEDAAWVADSGRFTNAIDEGTLSEVEPVKSVVRVNTDAITDVFCWNHPLPREQK